MARSGDHPRVPLRRRLLAVLATFLVAAGWLGVATPTAVADGPTTFTNPAAIAIPATGSADQTGPASPYPSTIAVSGMSGAVTKVTVAFNTLTHGAVNDIDALVVAPTGQNLLVLSDIGDPNTLATASNATLTFDDSAAGPVPTGNIPTGSYKPTNTGGGDTLPAPAPAVSSQTTLAGAFTGIDPNGTWRLFVVDDATGDLGTMNGGWSVTITTEVAAVATTTTVITSGSPSTTGDPVTFTATVRSGGSPVISGSVQFSDGGTALGPAVALNAAGQATLTTSALTEGTHEIRATYSGAPGFLTSNGSVTQRVHNETVVIDNTFCNPGRITVPGQGPAQPYPSNITVSGLGGEITKVTATLDGLSHQVPVDLDVMLAGPTPSTNVMLLSDAGGTAAVSGLDVTFDDDAAGPVPSPLVSGTFRATDNDDDAADLPFPAPAPAPSTATGLATFDGASANGTWSLWIVDDASGDSGSIANGWCLTVTSLQATETALASSVNPATFGQAVTLTATVTSDGTPVTDGSVQFSDGGSPLGSPVDVDGDGTASFTTSTLTVGTHAIRASYAATTEFGASADDLDQVVGKAATTTTLAADPNPSSLGQSVTFTATVESAGTAVPTGTVTFSVDGASEPAVALGADGTATFTTSSLTAGTHTIRAEYSGDASFAASDDDLQQVVNRLVTSTGLTSGPNPSSFGGTVTFTATVTSGGAPVTSGSVEFSDGGVSLGAAVPVEADGTATFTTAALAVGSHVIEATYGGTTEFAASSDTVTQVVEPAASVTAVGSDPNPSTFGQSVTFTATVTSGGVPLTSGSVQFSEGGTDLGGPVPLGPGGTATFTTDTLAAGTHTITASYSGTPDFAPSSGSVVQVVDRAATVTTVAADPNPSTFGQSVTFTATVTSGGVPLTSGSLQFSEGGTELGRPVPLGPGGAATFSTAMLAVGQHTITATFSGTSNFADSSGTVNHVVAQAATSTEVTSEPASSTVDQSVTFTAVVTSGGNPVDEGSVTFSVDGTVVQPATVVDAAGRATFTTTALSAGTHTILAEYSGSVSYTTSDDTVEHTVGLVADAGGPYSVAEGGSVTLDASASSPGALHEWDLNADGVFGDATGVSPTLSWADLHAVGIDDGPGVFDVAVRVTAGATSLDSATTTLTVTNTAPAAVVTGDLTATVGVPFTVKVGADDPSSADMTAQFSYTVDWGDGSPVQTVTGPADPPVTHTYTTSGQVDASFTATDKDGGQGVPTAVQVQVEPAQESPTPTPAQSPTSTSASQPTSASDSDTSTSGDGPLASTGGSSIIAAVLGVLLLLAGTTLVIMARRRRSAPGLHE